MELVLECSLAMLRQLDGRCYLSLKDTFSACVSCSFTFLILVSLSVQFDGRKVVSGAYDYLVKVWDPDTFACLYTLQGHTNRVYSLQVSTSIKVRI